MTHGMSIHIGLNEVDPVCHGGWNPPLRGCVSDARAMQALAQARGFEPRAALLDAQATAAAVKDAIGAAADELVFGDMLLVTYAGHGAQIPDGQDSGRNDGRGGDERDGLDETWVLYDRHLVDDELFALWGRCRPGVRVLLVSDSCHSGTVAQFRFAGTRSAEAPARATTASDAAGTSLQEPSTAAAGPMRSRAMPRSHAQRDYELHRAFYQDLQQQSPLDAQVEVAASVILLSGCQDRQQSQETPAGGVFTRALLQALQAGPPAGGYRALHRWLADRMPRSQQPNLLFVGAADPEFEAQAPFTI